MVKNWHTFQHYKDRKPPWIKLHRGLLDDYEFSLLPVESRALAPMLWLIASENVDGCIHLDSRALAFRLHLSSNELEKALNPLIDSGFFILEQDASNGLSHRQQLACSEAEAEREKRKRQQQQNDHNSSLAAAAQNGHSLYADESHASRFSFEVIKTYCEKTKPRVESPGAVARLLFRTGEEDPDVARWIKAEAQKKARAGILVGPNDDFDFEEYISGLIERRDDGQLKNERDGIAQRGGPKLNWERRVFDYFNQAADDEAAQEATCESSK